MTEQMDLGFRVEEMTFVPPSEWSPPAELPDRLYGVIGFDTETEDRGISSGKGSGWPWRGGKVVGYSVSADNFKGYLPVAHEGGGNMDPDLVRRWLNSVLGHEDQVKVGANTQYDVGWSLQDGVLVKGPAYDVQWAEALLDEHRWGYSLESIAKTHLGEGKNEDLLREAARAYGVDPKSGLWRLPAPLVGPYAETDADHARRIWAIQEKKLRDEDLWGIFELESALMPMYVDMRRRGVRVDLDLAEQLKAKWKSEVADEVARIKDWTGIRVDIWAAESLAKALDKEGVKYPRTEKTAAPSVTKQLLEHSDNRVCKSILKAREKDKLASTFIDGQILGHEHNGRVHGEFHPLRGDEGGSIGGRGSMSNPNLQFIPARTDEGKEVRKCFLPEEGERWFCNDFSQQEPRLLVHFAAKTKVRGEHLPGAIEARDRYRSDPKMDYHAFVAEITELPRKPAKILNLALIYGRGKDSTAAEMGKPMDEVEAIIAKHRAKLPFAPALSEVAQRRVRATGQIRTLLGRVCRFPFYEPADWSKSRGVTPLPIWKAKKEWPNEPLKRAWLYKVLNRLIQGSAADQTKKAMLEVHRSGLSKYVLIQVHDELDLSCGDEKTAKDIADVMRDAVQLDVPSVVDTKSGSNWGEAA